MVEHYSATKKGKLELSAGKWVRLEFIVLHEINQTHKLHYHRFSAMRNPKYKSIKEQTKG